MVDTAELHALWKQGRSYAELAAEFHLTPHGVRGRVSAYHRIASLKEERDAAVAALQSRQDAQHEAQSHNWDDTPKLRAYLANLRPNDEFRCILCWPDLHLPDHNEQAIALGFQLEEAINPDTNMIMGDVLDLDALGKYGQPRDRKREDALEEIIAPYHKLIDRMKKPTAALLGNHDGTKKGRMARALDELFTPLAVTIEEAYVDILRAGGRVWYLDGMNEIKINSVILQHGTRVGENAAKNAMKDRGYGVSSVGVHAHFPSLSVLSQDVPGEDGAYRIIMSAVLGTLSNLLPHYIKGTKKTRHIHCMGVVRFSLKTWVADIQPIVMHPTPDRSLVAWWGNAMFVQPYN